MDDTEGGSALCIYHLPDAGGEGMGAQDPLAKVKHHLRRNRQRTLTLQGNRARRRIGYTGTSILFFVDTTRTKRIGSFELTRGDAGDGHARVAPSPEELRRREIFHAASAPGSRAACTTGKERHVHDVLVAVA